MNPQTPQNTPAAGQAPQPPVNEYAGFSIGAVITIVGAALTLIGYPMVWFVAKLDDGATISGLGTTTSTENYEVTVETGRLHWLAGIAMIVLIGMSIARLAGKFSNDLKRITIILAVVGVLSAGLSVIGMDDAFEMGTGLYLALGGSIVALVGALVMTLAKK